MGFHKGHWWYAALLVYAAPCTLEAQVSKLPNLQAPTSVSDRASFDRYHVFHRPDTDQATAAADIRECDGYARGMSLNSSTGTMSAIYFPAEIPEDTTYDGMMQASLAMFGMGDDLDGDDTVEPSKRRRLVMRRCMYFKGYARYGLSKTSWQTFNHDLDAPPPSEADRKIFLELQAVAATGPKPAGEDLGE